MRCSGDYIKVAGNRNTKPFFLNMFVMEPMFPIPYSMITTFTAVFPQVLEKEMALSHKNHGKRKIKSEQAQSHRQHPRRKIKPEQT